MPNIFRVILKESSHAAPAARCNGGLKGRIAEHMDMNMATMINATAMEVTARWNRMFNVRSATRQRRKCGQIDNSLRSCIEMRHGKGAAQHHPLKALLSLAVWTPRVLPWLVQVVAVTVAPKRAYLCPCQSCYSATVKCWNAPPSCIHRHFTQLLLFFYDTRVRPMTFD